MGVGAYFKSKWCNLTHFENAFLQGVLRALLVQCHACMYRRKDELCWWRRSSKFFEGLSWPQCILDYPRSCTYRGPSQECLSDTKHSAFPMISLRLALVKKMFSRDRCAHKLTWTDFNVSTTHIRTCYTRASVSWLPCFKRLPRTRRRVESKC